MEYDSYVRGLEEKKRVTETGVEFWLARDLMPLLAYTKWANFKTAIEKARAACESAGFSASNHFADTGKMVAIGSGAQRETEDLYLTRYACYLIAMNSDSGKEEVGYAMTYFAVQTRRQEIEKQLSDEEKRLQLRMRLSDNHKKLAGAAKQAGVVRYPIFVAEGYRGFYGMPLAEVKLYRGLAQSEELLDRVGRLELSALDFKATLTEQRLNQNRVNTEQGAITTHRAVGEEVRAVMIRDNGVKPENLPTEPSIKRALQKRKRELDRGKTR